MRVYVAGPYMPPSDTPAGERGRIVEANIERANQAAKTLADLGHLPLVPHTMLRGWEDQEGISRQVIESLCLGWVRHCDALLFLAPSPGANKERDLAVALGLRILTLSDLPLLGEAGPADRQAAIQCYLVEYEQCAEGYRHGYETIWHAGGFFAAITAGIFALWSQGDGINLNQSMLALLPVTFWYQAIFRPMNGYGNVRRERLGELEQRLMSLVDGLALKHFSRDTIQRRGLRLLELFIRPRVTWYVTAVGGSLSLLEAGYWLVWLVKKLAPFI